MKAIAIAAVTFALLDASAALGASLIKESIVIKEVITKTTEIDRTIQEERFDIQICNNSDSLMALAVGYRANSVERNWDFTGWFGLERGECYYKTIRADDRTELPYAYHAYKVDALANVGEEGEDGTDVKLPRDRFNFTRYYDTLDDESYKSDWMYFKFHSVTATLNTVSDVSLD